MAVGSRIVAEKIRDEWDAQTEHIYPDTMPYQSLVCTAIDQMTQNPHTAIDRLIPYLETDTICFVGADRHDLVQKQEETWTPIRDRFSEHYGVKLSLSSEGIMLTPHPEETVETVRLKLRELVGQSPWKLAALDVATGSCCSLICGLQLVQGELSIEDAIRASHLEEYYNMQFWGEDQSWIVMKKRLDNWLGACQHFYKEMP